MKIIKILLFICVPVLIMALPMMWLWNWLVPDIFHGGTITFLQSAGLLLLIRLPLAGMFFRRHQHSGAGKCIKAQWRKMNDADKVAFKQQWKSHCYKRFVSREESHEIKTENES